MPKSVSARLLDLDAQLIKIACATTGEMSERALTLSGYCRFYAGQTAIRALQESDSAYAGIVAELNNSSDNLEEACKNLSQVAQNITLIATALDAVARLFSVIFGLLAL